MSRTHYTTAADILANALISDNPKIMQLDQLDEATQQLFASARLRGRQPVSVRWPGGQFALMLCEPGSDWPDPHKVVAAYQQCIQTDLIFPKGIAHGNQ